MHVVILQVEQSSGQALHLSNSDLELVALELVCNMKRKPPGYMSSNYRQQHQSRRQKAKRGATRNVYSKAINDSS
jgi:hypothetical protein